MCNFKNHYRSKKWYGHGRTGRTADDGPVSVDSPLKFNVLA